MTYTERTERLARLSARNRGLEWSLPANRAKRAQQPKHKRQHTTYRNGRVYRKPKANHDMLWAWAVISLLVVVALVEGYVQHTMYLSN